MNLKLALLLQLPPEILGYISVFCFDDFRTVCKHTRNTAYVWNHPCLCNLPNTCKEHTISALAKTQANCLILDIFVNPKYPRGKIQYVFNFACSTGNLSLAKLSVPKEFELFESGLIKACKYNHLEIVKYIQFSCQDIDLDLIFDYAVIFDSIDIIEYCISEGKIRNKPVNINFALTHACEKGNLELAKKYIKLGAYEITSALYSACYFGHLEMAKYFVKLFEDKTLYLIIDFHHCLLNACKRGHLDIVRYLVLEKRTCFSRLALDHACEKGNLEIIKFYSETYNSTRIVCCYKHRLALNLL